MATIRFFLASINKEISSIDVIVRVNKQRLKKGTGISVPVSCWDPKGQKVLKNTKTASTLNFNLIQVKSAIERVLYKMEKEAVLVDNAKLFWDFYENELAGRDYSVKINGNICVCDYINDIFLKRHNDFTQSRFDEFSNFSKLLSRFEFFIGRKLMFNTIDLIIYDRFKTWCISENKYSPNYASQLIKKLKQIMKEAQLVDKLHSNAIHQSAQFKTINEDVDHVYLTSDELKLIEQLNIDDEFVALLYPRSSEFNKESIKQSYNIVKNRFLIGCYTGLRVSDFNRLRQHHIYADNTIRIITQKTTTPTIIPINSVVRKIIDSGFDFNLALSNQKTCLYIKHICKMAKIDTGVDVRLIENGVRTVKRVKKYELVGTHTARRSFATNAYLAGVETLAICKITGHTTERMLLKYIKISKEENATKLASHPFFK